MSFREAGCAKGVVSAGRGRRSPCLQEMHKFLAADARCNLHGGERKPVGCLKISLQEHVLPAGLPEAAGQAGPVCAPLASKGGTHCSWDNSVKPRSRAARVLLGRRKPHQVAQSFPGSV